MPERELGALLLITAACALGCVRRPDRDKAITPARDIGIALPSLDGLGLTKVGSPDDGPTDAENWLRKVTVDVPVEGTPKVADARDASQWRGVALPRAENGPIPKKRVEAPPELRVRMDAAGAIRINRKACKDLAELRKLVAEALTRGPRARVVLDAPGAAPYGKVLPVMAVMAEQDIRFDLQAPPFDPTRKRLGELFDRLTKEAKGALKDRAGLPNVSLRIRADARAPWRAVQGVMIESMRAYVWRLSFVGFLDGHEVEVGHLHSTPDQPPESRDIPLGGTGVVGKLGIGRGGAGIYGFRT
ncbi:MAG: ExbD/TolR family protein, partial [Planctomycetota bacterium]